MQFDLNHLSVAGDRAGKLKERKESFPGGLRVGCGKVPVKHPHCHIRHGHLAHGHYLIFSMIELVHRSLQLFQVFSCAKRLPLLFAVAFLFAELGIALVIGLPFFDAERFQFGVDLGFAFASASVGTGNQEGFVLPT